MSSGIRWETRRAFACLVALVLLSSCQDSSHINQPTPINIPSVPSRITISAVSGIGAAAGEIYIAARVFDAQGVSVGSTAVTFSTNIGVVSPESVMADGGGLAQTTVKTTVPANIRAAAGSALATIDVTPNPPIVPIAPVDPPAPPTPIPPPSQGPFTIELLVSAGVAGSDSLFSLRANGGVSSATWTFGDGSATTTSSPSARHAYASANTYVAGVVAVDTLGRSASSSATVSISPATTTAPPGAAGLQIAMTCTPGAARSVACNLSASYNGVPMQSTPPTFTSVDWDWGDGQSQLLLPGSPLGTHTFVQAGTYTIVPHVTVLTIDGNKMATTSTSVTVP